MVMWSETDSGVAFVGMTTMRISEITAIRAAWLCCIVSTVRLDFVGTKLAKPASALFAMESISDMETTTTIQ